MPVIYFAGKQYTLEEGENLLSGLLAQHASIPFSCRAGVCHSCLLKAEQGSVPDNSQLTLSPEQVQKRCFLACQSTVRSDLSLSIPGRDAISARVTHLESVSATALQLTLSTRFPFRGQPGERIRISSHQGFQSQQTLQSIDPEQNALTLTIERKAGDSFSRFIHDETQPGDTFVLEKMPPD